MATQIPSEDEVLTYFDKFSNWGRWGADDQLGTPNLHVAYYTRAVIEDEAHDYAAAYRDYRQALALKPGYGAAARELARFKVAPLTAANTKN